MVQKNKLTILADVERILHTSEYGIAQLSQGSKACFDIIAKKKDQLIIIKIEPYIDNFSRDNSYELKNIASFLNASPMIIGERGRRFSEIDDGLVLLRYGIPVVSTETFSNLIVHGVPPIVYCSKGGYFVQIDRKKLRQARIEKNLSYADLAHLIGTTPTEPNEPPNVSVSKRTVYEYEHSINPPPETAYLLEKVLDTPITQGIKIFNIDIEREERPAYSLENLSTFKEEVSEVLEDLGFISQFWTRQSPFDAFGEQKNLDIHSGLNILVCVDESQQKKVMERASITQNIAALTKRRAIMIVDDLDQEVNQNVPTFTLEELEQMKEAFDLVKNWVKKYSDLKES
ncbi:MAG: hypothetical protein GOP50_00940 [Candidatus Heimdallarchaeota archaeon]|nr:hypothetical protein [Candidatus Heimdallarchaeota archaeon]